MLDCRGSPHVRRLNINALQPSMQCDSVGLYENGGGYFTVPLLTIIIVNSILLVVYKART